MTTASAGKKNRKIGRNSRRPCQQRYNSQRRWIKNKAIKILKHMKSHPGWSPVLSEINDEVIISMKGMGFKVKN